MPLESPLPPVTDHVLQLNRQLSGRDAASVLEHALDNPRIGRLALVSSFGADSVVLLHLLAGIDPRIPVLFVDTELLFQETLTYQQDIARWLGLLDMRVIRASRIRLFEQDPDGLLHHFDPDACCHLRKVEPLQQALHEFDGWITGRKRFQGGLRQTLPLFEADAQARIKINPLANWSPADIAAYIDANALPRHPLVAKGFPSLGCSPCTTPTKPGEGPRAGRWRGQGKIECGIHATGHDGTGTQP